MSLCRNEVKKYYANSSANVCRGMMVVMRTSREFVLMRMALGINNVFASSTPVISVNGTTSCRNQTNSQYDRVIMNVRGATYNSLYANYVRIEAKVVWEDKQLPLHQNVLLQCTHEVCKVQSDTLALVVMRVYGQHVLFTHLVIVSVMVYGIADIAGHLIRPPQDCLGLEMTYPAEKASKSDKAFLADLEYD